MEGNLTIHNFETQPPCLNISLSSPGLSVPCIFVSTQRLKKSFQSIFTNYVFNSILISISRLYVSSVNFHCSFNSSSILPMDDVVDEAVVVGCSDAATVSIFISLC